MTQIVLHFAHAANANYLVAGIPAAARAVHRLVQASSDRDSVPRCVIAVPGGWSPSAWCRAELARLAPDLSVEIADSMLLAPVQHATHVQGEFFLYAPDIDLPVTSAGGLAHPARQTVLEPPARNVELRTALREAGDAIVRATGKPGDGIVSRHLNRPISQAITRFVLRFPGATPFHATFAAAGVGLAMAACLFLGGSEGLIAGAILFQAASILDGVDGEIARATFRSSKRGAMLDSVTDALTNLAFIAGATFNLWRQGHDGPAAFGAAGLAMLATGLFLLGRHARARGGPFTFDALKDHFRRRPSRLRQWLTWLTMRDFYAAAAAVLILVDLGPHLLVAFAAITSGWLAVTLTVLWRAPGVAQTHIG